MHSEINPALFCFQDDGRLELALETGAKIKLTTDEAFREKCTKDVLFLDYANLPKVVAVGKRIYIDDGLNLADNFAECIDTAFLIRRIMKRAGFVMNEDKSMNPEEAAQQVVYLGFKIDSVSMTLTASLEKMAGFRELSKGVSEKTRLPVRTWAKIRGTATSLAPALGSRAIMCTRSLSIH